MATITTGFINATINGININSSLPCSSGNYTNKTSRDVKFVVMHYTGNASDTAKGNANYFRTSGRKASANFFVDNTSIYQSVELRDMAWHCGTSGTYYHPSCRNTNSIGIEMCTSGNYIISEQTKLNSAHLCANVCKILGITANTVDMYVLRHYDCTRKLCPRQMAGSNNAEWVTFKSLVKQILGGSVLTTTSTPTQTTTTSSNLVSIGKTHAKNFIGQSNTSKNIDILTLPQLKSMVLQRAINLDYHSGLTLDGAFGTISKASLGSHYIEKGEKQYMVTCAEILMYLMNKDPNGLELPGIYGDGLVRASGKTRITATDFLTYIK